MRMLLRHHHEDLDESCKCEVLKSDKLTVDHPVACKQNTRIITLIPNQEFLDQLQKFPPNYPFGAGLCKRLYIRGGSRINPEDRDAKKIATICFNKPNYKTFLPQYDSYTQVQNTL